MIENVNDGIYFFYFVINLIDHINKHSLSSSFFTSSNEGGRSLAPSNACAI